jgi:hypothetical protein
VPTFSVNSPPDYPAATFAQPYGSAAGVSNRGRGLIKTNRTPYTQQYSLGIQRELSATWGLDVSYVGNTGRKNIFSYQFNQPAPGPGPFGSRLPFPDLAANGIPGYVTWGTSHYDSLQVSVRNRPTRMGLVFMGSYTWGKSLGNAISGPQFEGQPFRDARNWKADSGPLNNDIRHILSLSWIYELPWGKGKPLAGNVSGLANAIIGGWKFGGIAIFQSGYRLTVSDSFDNANTGSGNRPDQISDPNSIERGSRGEAIRKWFDTGAFRRSTPFTFGNAGVGTVVGPGFQNFDLSLYKDFSIAEQKRIQFRAEFFNALNHPNFGNPGLAFGTSSFGVISSVVGTGREVQLGLRFDF